MPLVSEFTWVGLCRDFELPEDTLSPWYGPCPLCRKFTLGVYDDWPRGPWLYCTQCQQGGRYRGKPEEIGDDAEIKVSSSAYFARSRHYAIHTGEVGSKLRAALALPAVKLAAEKGWFGITTQINWPDGEKFRGVLPPLAVFRFDRLPGLPAGCLGLDDCGRCSYVAGGLGRVSQGGLWGLDHLGQSPPDRPALIMTDVLEAVRLCSRSARACGGLLPILALTKTCRRIPIRPWAAVRGTPIICTPDLDGYIAAAAFRAGARLSVGPLVGPEESPGDCYQRHCRNAKPWADVFAKALTAMAPADARSLLFAAENAGACVAGLIDGLGTSSNKRLARRLTTWWRNGPAVRSLLLSNRSTIEADAHGWWLCDQRGFGRRLITTHPLRIDWIDERANRVGLALRVNGQWIRREYLHRRRRWSVKEKLPPFTRREKAVYLQWCLDLKLSPPMLSERYVREAIWSFSRPADARPAGWMVTELAGG